MSDTAFYDPRLQRARFGFGQCAGVHAATGDMIHVVHFSSEEVTPEMEMIESDHIIGLAADDESEPGRFKLEGSVAFRFKPEMWSFLLAEVIGGGFTRVLVPGQVWAHHLDPDPELWEWEVFSKPLTFEVDRNDGRTQLSEGLRSGLALNIGRGAVLTATADMRGGYFTFFAEPEGPAGFAGRLLARGSAGTSQWGRDVTLDVTDTNPAAPKVKAHFGRRLLTGTVTLKNGSDVAEGVGTRFKAEVSVGSTLHVYNQDVVVAEVLSDTRLRLTANAAADLTGALTSQTFALGAVVNTLQVGFDAKGQPKWYPDGIGPDAAGNALRTAGGEMIGKTHFSGLQVWLDDATGLDALGGNLTGTVEKALSTELFGGRRIVGTGTAFLSELRPGDRIELPLDAGGTQWVTVAVIQSDTELRTVELIAGDVTAGATVAKPALAFFIAGSRPSWAAITPADDPPINEVTSTFAINGIPECLNTYTVTWPNRWNSAECMGYGPYEKGYLPKGTDKPAVSFEKSKSNSQTLERMINADTVGLAVQLMTRCEISTTGWFKGIVGIMPRLKYSGKPTGANREQKETVNLVPGLPEVPETLPAALQGPDVPPVSSWVRFIVISSSPTLI